MYFRRAFAPAMPLVQVGNRVALFAPDLGLALAAVPWIGHWRCACRDLRTGLGPGRVTIAP